MSANLPNLIAHYLLTTYPSVLPTFLAAAHIPPPDPAAPPSPDLRTLVSDYVSSHLAQNVSDLHLQSSDERARDGSWRGWTVKDVVGLEMDEAVDLSGVRRTIEGVSAVNLLAVGVGRVPKREFDTGSAAYRASWPLSILTTSVDKSLKILDYETGEVDRVLEPHRAAILSFAQHPTMPRYLLTGSMDGSTVLSDVVTQTTLQTFKSLKFVIRVAFSPTGRFMATASYDRSVVIYEAKIVDSSDGPLPSGDNANDGDDDEMVLDDEDDPTLACEPDVRYTEVKRIKVESNPEAILFHPEENWLLFTLRESHLLHYVRLPPSTSQITGISSSRANFAAASSASAGNMSVDEPREAGRELPWELQTKSFNPHPMDTHISFAVLDLALHPSGKIVACLTGDHRGGAGERVLLYGVEPEETDRLGCIWTGGESDPFVLPRMAWLPDGTGLITTSPNGYIHLLTLQGERRSALKVHGTPAPTLGQASSEVVRDVCCVPTENGGWEAVSVGYDRMVRVTR